MNKKAKTSKPALNRHLKEVEHYIPVLHICARDGMVHFRSTEAPVTDGAKPDVLIVFSRTEAVDLINKMVGALRDACEQEF